MKKFSVRTKLLEHQQMAVDKVLPVCVSGLFMDMGTGKTRTAIELSLLRCERIDKVFWLCPVSLKETIKQEILKHTDCTSSDIYVFDNKTGNETMPKNCRWYIAGIESFSSSDRVTLAANAIITPNTFIILDESSYIKGHLAIRTKRITALAEKAKYRTILTGTPLSQGIVDLFSQMYFLSPKILGYNSFYSFEANHLEYHPKHPGLVVRAHNVPYLAEKIKPYIYQCTKDECLSIPDKIYKYRWVTLTEEQESAYEAAKYEFEYELDELKSKYSTSEELPESFWNKATMLIFNLFASLQTIVCGFKNERDDKSIAKLHKYKNNRVKMLLNIIESIPYNEKIIIWGKYKISIEEISAALKKEYGADSVAEYHGVLNASKREAELNKFRNKARFLIATQSCGGHGLNLQFCHWQLFYANGFKYSERIQAEDRCHRHGQTRKVTYIDILASDTIDEKISESLESKSDTLTSFQREVKRIKDDKEIVDKDKYQKLKDVIKGL